MIVSIHIENGVRELLLKAEDETENSILKDISKPGATMTPKLEVGGVLSLKFRFNGYTGQSSSTESTRQAPPVA